MSWKFMTLQELIDLRNAEPPTIDRERKRQHRLRKLAQRRPVMIARNSKPMIVLRGRTLRMKRTCAVSL
jgi:hypothetical protein